MNQIIVLNSDCLIPWFLKLSLLSLKLHTLFFQMVVSDKKKKKKKKKKNKHM